MARTPKTSSALGNKRQPTQLETPDETYIRSELWDAEQEAFEASPLGRLQTSMLQVDQEIVDKYQLQVESHPEAKRAMGGLCGEQKKALTQLVINSQEELARYRQHRVYGKKLLRLANESPRRYRKLQSKVDKARRAIGDLLKFAQSIDLELSAPAIRAAQNCLLNLDYIGGPQPDDHWKKTRQDFLKYQYLHPVPTNAVYFHTVNLYLFFNEDCRLSGNESEVRVAILRNAFWCQHGVRPVKFKPVYDGEESQGCTAVRQAISLYRSQRGKTR